MLLKIINSVAIVFEKKAIWQKYYITLFKKINYITASWCCHSNEYGKPTKKKIICTYSEIYIFRNI